MGTTEDGIVIREAVVGDASVMARIYNHYVSNTVVRFEEIEVPIEEIARRIDEAASAELPWLVAERGNGVSELADKASQTDARCARTAWFKRLAHLTIYRIVQP